MQLLALCDRIIRVTFMCESVITMDVHFYRNCCFLKVVHTTVESSVDTHYYDFSVLHTLKRVYYQSIFGWVVKFVASGGDGPGFKSQSSHEIF